tara:strand:- start:986 stop:1309 length:324 start_codon:yes stop_codon:yes gene_type:complete
MEVMSQNEWIMLTGMLSMIIGFMFIYRLAPNPPDWSNKDKKIPAYKIPPAPSRTIYTPIPDLGPLRGYQSFIAGKPRPVAGAAVRRQRKQHLINWDAEAKKLYKDRE